MKMLSILFVVIPYLVICYKIKHISKKNKPINNIYNSLQEYKYVAEEIHDYTIPSWVYKDVFKHNKNYEVKNYEREVSKYIYSNV